MSNPYSESPAVACIMGALVADAAARGLHWIYDVDRLAEIAARQNGNLAFTPVDPANYAGVKSYPVHSAHPKGAQTQYGAVLRVTLDAMGEGGFEVARHQALYAETFGPGGTYQGYIDRPTRGTLANLAAGQTDPSGIDDEQLPTLASLPALVARHGGEAGFDALVHQAISVTNIHADAFAYGLLVAHLLRDVVGGQAVPGALSAAQKAAPETLRAVLADALETGEDDPVAYAEKTGRACHLPMAVPLSFHILSRAESYGEAVEMNLAAGGDNAGRAILIGSVMGAAHGFGAPKGIPLGWMLAMHDGAAELATAQRVSVLRSGSTGRGAAILGSCVSA